MENIDLTSLVMGGIGAAALFLMGNKEKALDALKDLIPWKKKPEPVPTPVDPVVPVEPLPDDEKVDSTNLLVELFVRLKDGLSLKDAAWIAARAFQIFWMLRPLLLPVLFANLPEEEKKKHSL